MIDFWVANCVSARLISLSLHLSSSFSSVAGPGCQSEAAVGSPQATDVPAWQLGSEAARALLGPGRLRADRIILPRSGRLFAATRSHTYRQKMQRSFAAESLAPFGAVDEMLADDYSMENQQEAAEHFMVSELTAPCSSTTAG